MKAHLLFEEAKMAEARGELMPALQAMTSSLLDNPDNSAGWDSRGQYVLKLGDPFYAALNFDKAIALSPDNPNYYVNRGYAYADLGEYQKAFKDYDRAIELNPKWGMPYWNKANIHRMEKRLEYAEALYRQAIKCDPENANAHFGLALTLLEIGDFEEAWKEYDWRWKVDQLPPRGLKVPEWDGEPAEFASDVLLFYAEQGFGDVIQFIRYAPLLKAKWGGKILVEVKFPMARLARTMKGIDGVVVLGEHLPINMKKCLPMMSAPRIMGTKLDTIPAKIPYFYPSQDNIKWWQLQLKKLRPGLKVGICWAGGARPFQPIANMIDKKRSTTLAEFQPLCLPNISFVSLQVGPEANQTHSCPAGMHIGDWSSEIYDYYDTAALIECLDLVITVDTSVVHIAGAMGKPVWLLSRFDNCWRWLGKREDSPWYPSLRQFIQPASGDWSGLMQNVKRELQRYLLQRKAA